MYASGVGVMLLIPAVFWLLIGGMPGRRPPRQLDPYELGYLAGGPRRVAEMIIAEQAACGALRVDGAGMVRLAGRAARTGPYADALDRIVRGKDVAPSLLATSVKGLANWTGFAR